MRLIDAECLMRSMYHRAFETDGDTMWQSGCWVRYKAIEETVKEQITVDAVPVVRCKDCEWYVIAELKSDGTDDMRYNPSWCTLWDRYMKKDDYCSHAIRRENDTN